MRSHIVYEVINLSALSLKKDRPVLAKSFLKFQLAPNVAAMLPAGSVQEAVVLPTRRVMAMPNMPAALLGLINRRGRVFWVANLVRLLSLPDEVQDLVRKGELSSGHARALITAEDPVALARARAGRVVDPSGD